MNHLERLLKEVNQYYIGEADLYMINGLIPCELNELIYFIKKNFDNKYHRLLEKIKSPYGYWDHYAFKNDNIQTMDFDRTQDFNLIDYRTKKEKEYNLTTRDDDQELNILLKKTIDILNYVKQMENYNLEHTITKSVERNNE